MRTRWKPDRGQRGVEGGDVRGRHVAGIRGLRCGNARGTLAVCVVVGNGACDVWGRGDVGVVGPGWKWEEAVWWGEYAGCAWEFCRG